MAAAISFCLAAIVAACALLLHYEVLRFALLLAPRPVWPVRVRMLAAMGALLMAHGCAIVLYGTMAWALDGRLGGLAGAPPPPTQADPQYV